MRFLVMCFRESRYQRGPGAGRKPMPTRRVFEAIVYVLRTGCQKMPTDLDEDDVVA